MCCHTSGQVWHLVWQGLAESSKIARWWQQQAATQDKARDMAKRRATKEVIAARRSEIEGHLLDGLWTMALQAQLAKRHGCSMRSIREDARIVRLSWVEDQQDIDKASEKADWLVRLRQSIVDAKAQGHSHSVAKLLELEARALGLFDPVQVEVKNASSDPLELASTILEALPLVQQLVEHTTEPAVIIDVEPDECAGE